MFAACVINIWKKGGKPNGIYILSLLFLLFSSYFSQPCTLFLTPLLSVAEVFNKFTSGTGNSPANFVLELQHTVEMQLSLYFHVEIIDWKTFYSLKSL